METACALRAALAAKGRERRGRFAALAAAEAVKIERNSCGGDSGDERRWYRQRRDF